MSEGLMGVLQRVDDTYLKYASGKAKTKRVPGLTACDNSRTTPPAADAGKNKDLPVTPDKIVRDKKIPDKSIPDKSIPDKQQPDTTNCLPSTSKQISWLVGQTNQTTGLVDSYEGDGADNAYLYDQALVIMAFTKAGKCYWPYAKKIIQTLKSQQNSTGSWYNCYSAKTKSVCEYLINTGPNAWMITALNYYKHVTKDNSFSISRNKALTWLDSMRNTDKTKEYYGSLKYGQWYSGTIISTEHNISAYTAYKTSGQNTKASEIKTYLFDEMWSNSTKSNKYFNNVYVFWMGYNDFRWATDPQSWGTLAFGKTGPNKEDLNKTIAWLDLKGNGNGSTWTKQNYSSSIKGIKGFGFVTENASACSYVNSNFCGIIPIWTEGTEGVAAAIKSISYTSKYNYHNETKKVIGSNGGIPYSFATSTASTCKKFPCDYRYNSVASTAWYYFNEAGLNPLNPF